jgi:hypothetical protein
MKLAKSLLLGSAAGLMAVAGANAADLPVRAAAPAVDYVRVCNTYGAGFFFIPGTETCLRVSGFVRAEYTYTSTRARLGVARNQSPTNFFARGRLNLDSRTATEFGLLRTLTSIDFNANQGGGDSVNVINAFIQFGGLTAGRISSFYMYKWGNGLNTLGLASTDLTYGTTNVFAYTATFGQGFSATIALEDPVHRRVPGISGANYAGVHVPDVVAALNLTQGWGNATLRGALHEIRTAAPVAGRTHNRYGWAALAGVEFNLPMLSPGSSLWLQASYADGANNYAAHGGGAFNGRQLGFAPANAYVDPVTGRFGTTQVFGVSAGLTHAWTPTLSSQIQANYQQVRLPGFAQRPTGVFQNVAANMANNGYTLWGIGHTLNWRPVSGLLFAGEFQYARAEARRAVVTDVATGATRRTSDVWAARLRIQRDF